MGTAPADDALRRLLSACCRIAIVGISDKWHRPSFFVAKYLLEHGYEIIPITPVVPEVLGHACYPALDAVPAEIQIDMVDVFRRESEVLPIAEQAAARGGITVFWQQLGVDNQAATTLAVNNGMQAVSDRCVKIEHARLFGGLNWAGVNTRVISARRPRQLPY